MIDFSRIESVINVTRTQNSTVGVVGVGAARDLLCDLVHCGVGRLLLFDPDRVEWANIARQGFTSRDVGRLKVEAAADELRRINPAVDVLTRPVDFLQLGEQELDELLHSVDVLILATDRFAAQARGNEVALRLGIPAVWIGLYHGGVGGEVIFWHPGLDTCYRCLCCCRYEAQARAQAENRSLDPASDGATLLDVHLIDAIAGQLVIGLLTRGADNRHGRLIDELGERNFIQVKLAPEFVINGRDLVRERLQVPAECETFFAWNAIALCDPDHGQLYCPDCERFRGHRFVGGNGSTTRLRQDEITVKENEPR